MNQEIDTMRSKLKEADSLLNQKELLTNKMENLSKALAEINTKLACVLDHTVVSKPTAKRRRQNLRSYLLRCMAPGAHMHLWEIAKDVLTLGYQTEDQRFNNALSTFLSKQNDIKRVRHGVYTLVANGDKKKEPEKLSEQLTLGSD